MRTDYSAAGADQSSSAQPICSKLDTGLDQDLIQIAKRKTARVPEGMRAVFTYVVCKCYRAPFPGLSFAKTSINP
jgi:hypothetical protein